MTESLHAEPRAQLLAAAALAAEFPAARRDSPLNAEPSAP